MSKSRVHSVCSLVYTANVKQVSEVVQRRGVFEEINRGLKISVTKIG